MSNHKPLLEDSSNESSPSSDNSMATTKPMLIKDQMPLISEREKSIELVAKGLKPLQLAILYGRISVISKLWHAKHREMNLVATNHNEISSHDDNSRIKTMPDSETLRRQRQAISEYSMTSKQLKRVIMQACWHSKEELKKFLKSTLLKTLLIIDLSLLTLMMSRLTSYLDTPSGSIFSNLFFLSYCTTIFSALRVILKNPGYLRRNSVQYLEQMSKLLAEQRRNQVKDESNSDIDEMNEQQQDLNQSDRSEELIRLDSADSSPNELLEMTQKSLKSDLNNQSKKQITNSSKVNERSEKESTIKQESEIDRVIKQSPVLQTQFDLKDAVRLLCHKCQCIRRPRSRHCNYCNHCVQDFDHHCIYLGCCIGRQNRLDFVIMLIFLTITSAYGSLLNVSLIGELRSWSFWHFVSFMWIFKYVLIGLFGAFENLRRACSGITMYEEIRSKRIRHLFGRTGPPAEISESHRNLSTLKGSFWRYSPDKFLVGDLTYRELKENIKEFSNSISFDEYLLTVFCSDTPLARALTSSDMRCNTYKLAS